jgi:hypothetical protein
MWGMDLSSIGASMGIIKLALRGGRSRFRSSESRREKFTSIYTVPMDFTQKHYLEEFWEVEVKEKGLGELARRIHGKGEER